MAKPLRPGDSFLDFTVPIAAGGLLTIPADIKADYAGKKKGTGRLAYAEK